MNKIGEKINNKLMKKLVKLVFWLARFVFWLAYLGFDRHTWFLVGILDVLVGILDILVGVIDVFDIGMLYLLHFLSGIVWINFAKAVPSAFFLGKSTPAWKKYTTASCGGCDKYQVWFFTFVSEIMCHYRLARLIEV